jgi:hypothetical protein
MHRDPIKEFMKDPDNRAKAFMFVSGAMILSTIAITIGALIFIIHLVGIF